MGISERKQREKEQRRHDIILAAEGVFFSKGIHVATVDEVAEAAELSKGTLYLYFKNREELIAAVFHRGMDLLQQMMVGSSLQSSKAIDKIRALGRVYLDFAKKHPDHFALLLEKELHRLAMDDSTPEAQSCVESGLQLLTMLKLLIIQGIQEGSIRNDIDPARMALIVWGQIHGVIAIASQEEHSDHFQKFCSFDLESIVTTTIEMIVNGIIK
ncbi:MAG: TetR/AcrR family transcriptional regulator [Chitinispirillaceae bacterium]|nr:TetR/AcrR family transcriptional regulator [Chitinispirillaceae bacterium]